MAKKSFAAGDPLELKMLFLGNGLPLIGDFLRCLIHLGHLGMVNGTGRFTVKAVYDQAPGQSPKLTWRQDEPVNSLTCSVQSLDWLLEAKRVVAPVVVKYLTPVRLMVDGKPLRKPSFSQVFPFILRRVTSMVCTHGGIELLDDPEELLAAARALTMTDARLTWHDWRSLTGSPGLVVGGFMGEMCLSGPSLEKIYWVLALASLLNIGKGATYGAGQYTFAS